MTRTDWSRLAVFSAIGVLLSSSFVFLAALPIRYLRLTFGRKLFLLSSAVGFGVPAAFGLWQWAVPYASICLIIGFYREMEEKRLSIFLSSCVTLAFTSGLGFIGLFGYSQYRGATVKALILEYAQPFMEVFKQVPQYKDVNLDTILWYIPSGIVITMMIILFVSLTAVRYPVTQQQRIELRMFRLPDWLIWVFIGSLGASYIKAGAPWLPLVAKNVLAVILAAYFFQGLAVLNHFLDKMKVFGIWRLLAHFLAIFQLFIFVIGLGILDYWFDFRIQGLIGPNKQNFKKI